MPKHPGFKAVQAKKKNPRLRKVNRIVESHGAALINQIGGGNRLVGFCGK